VSRFAAISEVMGRKAIILLALLATSGCLAFTVVNGTSRCCDGVEVTLVDRHGDLFRLLVRNRSRSLVTLYRDAIVLQTPTMEGRREPGGLGTRYSLAPGEQHFVHVRFDLSGVRAGERVALELRDAVTVGELPSDLTPLTLIAR
jgi:hypothetical protein